MKKYIFSEKVGKKVTKHEIVAETLEEAYDELMIIGFAKPFLPDYIEPVDNPDDLELKTYNISYYADARDALDSITTTITYKATSAQSAEGQFLEDFPDQAGNYRETHSPLSNDAVDRKNAETKTNDNTKHTNLDDTTDTTIPHKHQMKKINILNVFKTVNDYVKQLTLLLIGLIPLLLLGVVIFGDDFFLGNVVVWNIQNLLDSMAGFVGIITLLVIVYFYTRIEQKDK
jgi:TM2 domain-containing membrane protein YozV